MIIPQFDFDRWIVSRQAILSVDYQYLVHGRGTLGQVEEAYSLLRSHEVQYEKQLLLLEKQKQEVPPVIFEEPYKKLGRPKKVDSV